MEITDCAAGCLSRLRQLLFMTLDDTHSQREQHVEVARDDRNLYVLFTLGVGIVERHEKQLSETGQATSSAVGYLHLSYGDQKFTVWVPTGISFSKDSSTGKTIYKPIMSFKAGRGMST